MQLEQLTTPSGALMQGPLLITPQAFGDDRGWFYESWNQRKFDEAVGESVLFSQETTTPAQSGVCFGVCTISSHRNPRPSWYVPRSDRFTTSPSTSGATRPPTALGSAPN